MHVLQDHSIVVHVEMVENMHGQCDGNSKVAERVTETNQAIMACTSDMTQFYRVLSLRTFMRGWTDNSSLACLDMPDC